jgi:AcrR family transcriptional regulator
MTMDKSETKRSEILDAAMLCLARYGANKTTLDDIAGLVGLNKATLYYYYQNREAIFIDALEREAQRFIDTVRQNFRKNARARDKMYVFLKTYLSYLQDRAEILELNARAMVDNQIFIRKIHGRMREKNSDLMREIVREGMDSGEFRNMNAERVADSIRYIFDLRLLEFFTEYMESGHQHLDIKRLKNDARYILEIFLHGILKKE